MYAQGQCALLHMLTPSQFNSKDSNFRCWYHPNVTKLWPTLGEAARKRCGMETHFCGVTFEIRFSRLSHPQNSSFLSRDPICSIPFYWATRGIKILMNMHLLKYWVNYKKPKILSNHCPKVQYCYLRQYYYLIIRSLVSWLWLIYLNS